ncbi:hypothetical protein BC941DRAFT_425604 [Chlamydoabsidia padenii]|nr:hypothetical protein BC941DRAFT_425604 [Chlamydoabsidia padenii]
MLITYQSLILAIVVILQVSYCLGHGNNQHTTTSTHTITTHHTHHTHHTHSPSSSSTSSTRPTKHHSYKHGHRKTKTHCTTKTLHPKPSITTHHHSTVTITPTPHTTVKCSTKVVWIYPTPKHKGSSHKSTTKKKHHKSTKAKHTPTKTAKQKHTTTPTPAKDHGEDSPVHAYTEANVVSTPKPTADDPNEVTPTEQPAPTSDSNVATAAAAAAAAPSGSGGGSNPNNNYIETQAVENDGSTNKSLGLGLGLGVGCVAALGLAGLLVHSRRRNQQQISDTTQRGDPMDNTRWRPQSFMGVVASVVAKLPRSPSQRSQASSTVSTGMAVGSGNGAVEITRHPSTGSPPPLARVDEVPHYQY